jgi:hypothetical protein
MNQRQRMRSRFGIEAADSTQVKNSGDKQSRLSIDLRIDRLVLAGIPAGERFRIADAMNRELTRILSEQGFPFASHDSTVREHLDGGDISLERNGSSETLGNLVAQAVYRGISNPESKVVSDGLARSPDRGNLPKS